MNAKLEAALEHADKASKFYGLNIRANTISLLREAVDLWLELDEGLSKEHPDTLATAWREYSDDLLKDEETSCNGHMSLRDIGVLVAECEALAEVVVSECLRLREAEEALTGESVAEAREESKPALEGSKHPVFEYVKRELLNDSQAKLIASVNPLDKFILFYAARVNSLVFDWLQSTDPKWVSNPSLVAWLDEFSKEGHEGHYFVPHRSKQIRAVCTQVYEQLTKKE
jgi:hypothetical protein